MTIHATCPLLPAPSSALTPVSTSNSASAATGSGQGGVYAFYPVTEVVYLLQGKAGAVTDPTSTTGLPIALGKDVGWTFVEIIDGYQFKVIAGGNGSLFWLYLGPAT